MFRTLGDMIRKTQKYLLLIKNTYITDNIRTLPPKQRFVEVGQLASENKEGITVLFQFLKMYKMGRPDVLLFRNIT